VTCLFKEEVVSQMDPNSIPNEAKNPPKAIQNSDQNRIKIEAKSVQNRSGSGLEPMLSGMGVMKPKKEANPQKDKLIFGTRKRPQILLYVKKHLKIAPEGLRRRFQEMLKTSLNIEGS